MFKMARTDVLRNYENIPTAVLVICIILYPIRELASQRVRGSATNNTLTMLQGVPKITIFRVCFIFFRVAYHYWSPAIMRTTNIWQHYSHLLAESITANIKNMQEGDLVLRISSKSYDGISQVFLS